MSDRVLEALQRVLQNRKNSNFTVDDAYYVKLGDFQSLDFKV